jgi:hypothetical protein
MPVLLIAGIPFAPQKTIFLLLVYLIEQAMPFSSFCLRNMTFFFQKSCQKKIKNMEKRAKSRKRSA